MKQLYEAPQVQVLEMEVQGLVMEGTGNTVSKPSDYPAGSDGFTF